MISLLLLATETKFSLDIYIYIHSLLLLFMKQEIEILKGKKYLIKSFSSLVSPEYGWSLLIDVSQLSRVASLHAGFRPVKSKSLKN